MALVTFNYQRYISNSLTFAVYVFLLILIIACKPTDKPREIHLQGKTMGTQYHISIPLISSSTHPQPNQKHLKKEIDGLLQAINQEMSTYIADSTISRFNQSHSPAWFPVSKEFLYVIQSAQKISLDSQGAFDITVMPLVNLWGFGTSSNNKFPTQAEINDLRNNIGYQLLETQQYPPAIRKKNPKLMIDLSAIAKGYAVDAVADLLRQKSLKNFLVEIGGEIRTQGKNKNKTLWKVAIEKPTTLQRSVQQGLLLDNIAVATSGDYRNYYEKAGKRYSHTINPKTGKPITHKLASVTVLHQSTMIADAQATAIMVLGEQKGKEYAQKQGLEVYMIFREGGKFSVWHNLSTKRLLLHRPLHH